MIALTREVPASIVECQLTHVGRQPIDVLRARVQHAEYEEALRILGCEVVRLPAEQELPDSVFVEDAAIVLDELAVLMRPGAMSRRAEVASVAEVLSRYRPLSTITPPDTIDGGDVLRLRGTLWVGLSSRTNAPGARQLGDAVSPFGYEVRVAEVRGALHLKSAVTQVGANLLLVNPDWIDPTTFDGWEVMLVDPTEPFAANAVMVNGALIHSTQFPRTQERLQARGIRVIGVDASELSKAEGGVTCCSLLLTEKP